MFRRVYESMIAGLQRQSFPSEEALHQFLATAVANSYCFGAHLLMLILFAAEGNLFFALLNVGSLLVYGIGFWLFRFRRYFAIGLMISIEVATYATVYGLLAGISTYVLGYYVLVILMQMTVPYGAAHSRAWMIGVSLLGVAVCTAAHLTYVPPIVFGQTLHDMMLVVNITLLMLGTVVELFLGQLLRNVAAKMNMTQMQALTEQATLDPLTGLYNRRHADAYFGALREGDAVCCVAMLDIDDFKVVNDTYGHACGDEILVFVANFLRASLRKTDAIFRWGGEEFLIVLENTTLPSAQEVLRKLQAKLAEATVRTGQGPQRVTVTIGVAALDTKDIAGCIERCDRSMYQGKMDGKNQVVAERPAAQ